MSSLLARWTDRRRPSAAEFKKSIRVLEQYAREMRKIAREVGRIVSGFPIGDPASLPRMEDTLARYADLLDPWAKETAKRIAAQLDLQDLAMWREHSRNIGRALAAEIATAPTGQVFKTFMAEQVPLIKSLPLVAAERVHRLTILGMQRGARPEEIAAEIAKTGQVTAHRATLIARTEVARASATLTRARAEYVGSDSYIWRTAEDSDVRPRHRRLNGKVIRWSDPPIAGERGERAHAGCIYSCRCYPEPVIPAIH